MSLEEIDLHNDNLFNTIKQTLAMIVFDIHGQILWANDKFSNVVGYDVEELTKMHHRELCTNTFRNSEEYTTFWRHLQENKAFHDKVERVQKSGEIVWLDAMYTPVVNESGHVESVIKIASDITKQESVLKKSSTEFIALVEKMTASTDDVHAVSIQASKDMDVLEQESETVRAHIEKIENMTTAVKKIASQSKILGLNAGIEAARAGEQGRGFSVVANEVQKMAADSNQSAEDIVRQLEQISKSVDIMTDMVKEATDHINRNTVHVEALKNAYEDISKTAEELITLL